MKPRNGGLKSSSQDYMNLLYTDSDSDTPDLKLPPLKGKKPRKKKSSYKSVVSSDTSVCSLWTMLKIITVIVVLATVAVLGVICYWLMGQVYEMKSQLQQIQQVESRNQGAPEEFQKYHSQIQSINRTVQDMRTGARGMDKITKNLTTITTQLSSLSQTTDGLKESLKAAPELKDLPKKFDTFTSSVASMGSDIQVAKNDLSTLTEFQKSAEQQLQDLTKRVKDMESKPVSAVSGPNVQPGREKGSAAIDQTQANTLQMLNQLTQDINKLNLSLVAKIEEVNSSLLTHETRLSLLENFTSHQQPSPTASPPTVSKGDAVNALKSLLIHGAPMDPSSSSSSSGDMAVLSILLGRVENNTVMLTSLKDMFTKLQSDMVSINASQALFVSEQGGEHSLLQTDTMVSLEYLNSTVLKLTEAVDQLFVTFTKNRNELNNATAHIAGILRFLHAQFPSGNLSTPGKTPASVATPAPTTVKPTPAVVIKGINNLTDLSTFFNRWDIHGDGKVDPDILPDFLGAAAPSKEQLRPFDADSDGKYTMQEFAAALGFKSQTDHTDTTEEDLQKIFA
ncbi:EF-hand calcium-binding domain-containing protein 14-like isoform X3 [Haliotis cracherodii]|uniref:EF-hand calcium-binding domain-containing protein 14-like isoform X3 n=1 Tax=Haliotis cracherodii TaxID=6455 RepID=UPI0039EBD1E5